MTDSSRSNRRWQSSILNSALAMKFQGMLLCFCRPSQAVVEDDCSGWMIEPGGHSSPINPIVEIRHEISVTQKHGFWSVFPRSAQFFHFPWTEHPASQQAPSFVYWLVDRRSRNDFEVTSSWLYPWWSGPPKLQPWSSARTATTGEKTRRVVLGGMLLGNRVIL